LKAYLLKNSRSTDIEKTLAFIGRPGRFMLGAHTKTPMPHRSALKSIPKQDVDGVSNWIRIWRKVARLGGTQFMRSGSLQ